MPLDIELPDGFDFVSSIVYTLGLCWLWQVTFLVITEVLQLNVVNEEGYMTSLRLLTRDKPHGAILFMY